MYLYVVWILQRVYVLVPVDLMFCNVISETRHDRSIEGLERAADLGLKCIPDETFYAQTDRD